MQCKPHNEAAKGILPEQVLPIILHQIDRRRILGHCSDSRNQSLLDLNKAWDWAWKLDEFRFSWLYQLDPIYAIFGICHNQEAWI